MNNLQYKTMPPFPVQYFLGKTFTKKKSTFKRGRVKARYWVSGAKLMRTELCPIITQRLVVIPYLRTGAPYLSLELEDGNASLSRNFGKELPLYAA